MLNKQSPLYQIYSKDLDQSHLTSFRYLILSSPRTGSSMLCSALRATDMAGMPFEYFHPEGLRTWFKERSETNIFEFVNNLERRRTTSNGYFGIKVHYNQWKKLCESHGTDQMVEYLGQQDRVILVTRRNKIRQAISCLVAQKTNIWQIEIDEKRDYKVPSWQDSYSFEITQLLFQLSAQEFAWKKTLRDNQIQFLELAYEDMSELNAYFPGVLNYLSLDECSAQKLSATTKKVDSDYREILEGYKTSIGFND